MANDDTHRITRLLGELRSGNKEAEGELAELVYADLLRVALQRMAGRGGVTLEPAALVHECWLRLADQRKGFESRSQFLAVASRIMLRVVLDAGRRHLAERRGGGRERVTLSFEIAAAEEEVGVDVEWLEEALERLERFEPRKAQVARLRGLVGLSTGETAAELDVSIATIERDWAFGRAWLSREVQRLRAGTRASGAPADGFSGDP